MRKFRKAIVRFLTMVSMAIYPIEWQMEDVEKEIATHAKLKASMDRMIRGTKLNDFPNPFDMSDLSKKKRKETLN